MKVIFNNTIFTKIQSFLFHFLYYEKKSQKSKFFISIFWSRGNFFDILLIFAYFLQTYYDTYFFHILFMFFSSSDNSLYLFFALLLILFYYFCNNLLPCLVSHLYFFDNKFYHSFFIYNKKFIHFFYLNQNYSLCLLHNPCTCTKSGFYNHFF